MNEPADKLLSGVEKWIESSGRALELRTQQAFRLAGYRTKLSRPYKDPSTGTLREGDVAAIKQMHLPAIENGVRSMADMVVAIECKHTTDKPWVAFYSEPEGSSTAGPISTWSPSVKISNGQRLLKPQVFPFGDVPATADHIAAATIGSTKEDTDARNTASDAVRQALSWSTGIERPGQYVVVAAIVTTAKLFEARLDSDGQVGVRSVDNLVVWGSTAEVTRCRVHIINESHLDRFIRAIDQYVQDAVHFIPRV